MTYFKWDNEFYDQLNRVATENHVSPVIAKKYAEAFTETPS